MKAIVLQTPGGPENLRYVDMTPPVPRAGEVRVKLKASALNRRDVWICKGRYPDVRLPAVPGSDGAGVVESVGPATDASLVSAEVLIYPAADWGDDPAAFGPEFRILGMPDQGTFAEFIVVPEKHVYPRPAHLSWTESAAIPLAGLTAWRAVTTQGNVAVGHKVLITGAGSGVSTLAILFAAQRGAEVFVTSSSRDKITAATLLGARDGVVYSSKSWVADLREMAGSFDVIIDSAGGDGCNALLELLKPAGQLVLFGATLGPPSTGLDLRSLFWRQLRIQGTTMGTQAEFGDMLGFISERKLRPRIDSVFHLADAVTAVQRVLDFKQTGKVVFVNDPDDPCD